MNQHFVIFNGSLVYISNFFQSHVIYFQLKIFSLHLKVYVIFGEILYDLCSTRTSMFGYSMYTYSLLK